ncbi:hypothetical protein E2C01_061315 [Portunus trituberculatus]|uniref:Uncharacterized protein n=1 Tax=Portunus trituberculatus TaxID=210409 RepID=A0A5B7HBC1_PORTR|nr:hypothetical protein [Portunus trituberculatus]
MTPSTDPSFLPSGRSSSTPAHSPAAKAARPTYRSVPGSTPPTTTRAPTLSRDSRGSHEGWGAATLSQQARASLRQVRRASGRARRESSWSLWSSWSSSSWSSYSCAPCVTRASCREKAESGAVVSAHARSGPPQPSPCPSRPPDDTGLWGPRRGALHSGKSPAEKRAALWGGRGRGGGSGRSWAAVGDSEKGPEPPCKEKGAPTLSWGGAGRGKPERRTVGMRLSPEACMV